MIPHRARPLAGYDTVVGQEGWFRSPGRSWCIGLLVAVEANLLRTTEEHMFDVLGIPINVFELSGWGLLVLLIATGKLRTSQNVKEIRDDRDARLAEAAEWKTAWEKSEETKAQLVSQVSQLLALGQVSAHILGALPSQEEKTESS
jgi:hypothetical protein